MQGDHADLLSFDRASLRRLARQVQRREDPGDRFDGESSLWYVASHVPAIIKKRRPVTLVAPGCYRIGPDWFSTFWITANDLPLVDGLVPFLVARTAQSLDAFVRWVKTRRPRQRARRRQRRHPGLSWSGLSPCMIWRIASGKRCTVYLRTTNVTPACK